MSSSNRFTLSAVLLVLGCSLMLAGTRGGELLLIMQKAVLVCLECIGLG
ncbi:MAG: hypothetical protein FWE76_00985 [Symbiobacteriaceae bacterium]|nr:hypothetical protein [Symbiobacteriaceae bacterium]